MGGQRELIERGIRELYPGYFALVMATGILSIASFQVGFESVARLLLPVNIIAYAILCLLTWIVTFVGLFRGLGSGLLVARLPQDRDLAMGEAPRKPAPPRRE